MSRNVFTKILKVFDIPNDFGKKTFLVDISNTFGGKNIFAGYIKHF